MGGTADSMKLLDETMLMRGLEKVDKYIDKYIDRYLN